MPWEIDYALLTFSQLKKSKYYLPNDVSISIDSVLNLSSYIIDWQNSKLPKQFFIEKYNQISNLLIDYKHNKKIYDEDKLYGHLDLQRDAISTETDYYISMCPDIYFTEHLLYYLIESSKNINQKYFVLTPQIHKLWDSTWDEITDKTYMHKQHSDWDKVDTFDIRYNMKTAENNIEILPIINTKFAGWFDLYNKAFYEELCPIHSDWSGYGPWDWYCILLTEYLKSKNLDYKQFLLKGQTIFQYSSGVLKSNEVDGFSKYYKDFLVLKNIPNQRSQFEKNMSLYLGSGIEKLKKKGII
jgi:hypothetical protein